MTTPDRGGKWVAVQAALIIGVMTTSFALPWDAPGLVAVLGLVLVFVGVVLNFAGLVGLGSSFSPFPKPLPTARIRQQGIYGSVRHPIYGGIICWAVGWSLMQSSVALVPSALLTTLLVAKSRKEEQWLTEHDPAYQDYRTRVKKRFIPGLV